MAAQAEPRFAGDFEPVDEQQWRAAVDGVLKGAPFDRLVSSTADGISLGPLYVDGPDDSETGAPGAAPFTRGFRSVQHTDGLWDVRTAIDCGDAQRANAAALRELERGATSLALCGGVPTDAETLGAVLDGVLLDLAPVVLSPGAAFVDTAESLMRVWSDRGIADADARGGFGADPIGTLARTGAMPQGIDRALADAAGLARMTAGRYPGVRAISIDATAVAEGGATEGTELAYMLSCGAQYLRSMADAGLGADDASGQLEIVLGADPDFFTTIAKLRAARRLWAAMTQACGVDTGAAPPRLAVRTLHRCMSRRDPWVNLLRVTSAAFAAALGGADTITTVAFDSTLGEPGELGRRMARNTQLLLAEESGVGRVIDPAGGSWYVESLTDSLAVESWSQFRTLEGSGGLPAVLLDGTLAARVATARDRRLALVATRKAPITGVSEYPDLHEEPLRAESTSSRRDAAAIDPDAVDSDATATLCEAIEPVRWAQGFEVLRDAADRAAATGERPRVFLANLGSVATHTARATWARNLFAAGGIDAVTSQRGSTVGFDDPAQLAADFAESGASLVCVCSSDATYAERGVEMVEALAGAGAIYLAGNPADLRESLVRAGVDTFVHVGVDVLATLRTAHELLGIDPAGVPAEEVAS